MPRVIAGLLVLLASCAGARDEGALSAAALMTHVRVLAQLHGRLAGSADERAAVDYVEARLRAIGLAPEEQAIPETGSRNVYALIAGRSDEVVVIGAHLDHLGPGYPGADDDASGVAAVLGVAASLDARRGELARSVLIVFFGAEEEGMVGSRAFVADPPVPLARIVAMVNVDMIGRPVLDQRWARVPLALFGISRERAVGLVGTARYPGLRAIADRFTETVAPEDLPATIEREGEAEARGRGDSVSFEAAGIPALFFGDAESRDYHRPTDTIARLHPELLARSARAIARTVFALSTAPASAFAPSDATPPKRYPRGGWYLPFGVVGALGAGARAGAEMSLVHLWSGSIAYAGVYADALRGGGATRVSIGPEVGWRWLGVDGGYVLGGGAVARVFATASVISLGLRGGEVRGRRFAEVELLLKFPLRL